MPGPHRTLASNPNTQRTNVPGPHRTLQRKTEILPSNPANPLPYVQNGSWAGIPNDVWNMLHTEFLSKNPEFKERNFDETGRPEFVKRCVEFWNDDVMVVKRKMNQRKPHPTDPPNFRDRLEEIVRKAGFVDQAVCIALGQFDKVEDKWKNAFMHQLAFFLLLREMLEEKQGNTIPMVFQDPGFKSSEEYVLSALAGGKVVEHPEALNYMTESSFVFGPFVQHNVFGSTVLLKRPILYIGNRIENEFGHPMGCELARRYIRKAYMTADHAFGPDMEEFVRQTDAFHEYYEKEVLDNLYDLRNRLKSAFRNLFVHYPKRQHPRPVVSNTSAFGFAAVKSVSTAPSIGHLTDSADTMSSASDDTALSSTTERLCVNSDADSAETPSKSVLERSQGVSSGAAEPVVPPFQQARPEVGLKGTIHASARRGSSPNTAQSPINPALDPRSFPHRNRTDKLKDIWRP